MAKVPDRRNRPLGDLAASSVVVDDVEALGYPLEVRSRTSSLWPDDRKGPWIVSITWVESGSDVVPAGIDVRSFDLAQLHGSDFTPGPTGVVRLNSTDLGKLPIARLVRLHQRHVIDAALALSTVDSRDPSSRDQQRDTAMRAGAPKTHRGDYGAEHWQLVADLYVEAADIEVHHLPGDQRPGHKPALWVASKLRERGYRQVDDATVRTWIRRARQYGYLKPSTRRSKDGTE